MADGLAEGAEGGGAWASDGEASGELVANGSGVASSVGTATGDPGVASGEDVAAGSGVGDVVTGGGGAGGSERVHALAADTSINAANAPETRTISHIMRRGNARRVPRSHGDDGERKPISFFPCFDGTGPGPFGGRIMDEETPPWS